jgi:hypothetical protein
MYFQPDSVQETPTVHKTGPLVLLNTILCTSHAAQMLHSLLKMVQLNGSLNAMIDSQWSLILISPHPMDSSPTSVWFLHPLMDISTCNPVIETSHQTQVVPIPCGLEETPLLAAFLGNTRSLMDLSQRTQVSAFLQDSSKKQVRCCRSTLLFLKLKWVSPL